MSEQLRRRVFLAALLHDVGKFYQRADKSFTDKYNELSDCSRRMADDICPVDDPGRSGYRHTVWTNEFIGKYGGIIGNIPGLKTDVCDGGGSDDSTASLAGNHHKPKTETQALVTLADCWSAGIDRTDPRTLEQEQLSARESLAVERGAAGSPSKIVWGGTGINAFLYTRYSTRSTAAISVRRSRSAA